MRQLIASLMLLTSARAYAEAPAEVGPNALWVGAKVGAEIGGPLGESAGLVDVEVGLLPHERLALVLGFGLAWCEREDHLIALPARDGLGPGYAMVESGLAPRLALEVRYRQPLGVALAPVGIDFAVGAVVSRELRDTIGPTFFSGEPGCDPREDACPLTLGTADVSVDPRFAVRFGLDLRFGPAFAGYRAVVAPVDAATSHEMFLGTTF